MFMASISAPDSEFRKLDPADKVNCLGVLEKHGKNALRFIIHDIVENYNSRGIELNFQKLFDELTTFKKIADESDRPIL
jgi:hypothetical protein